MAHGKQTCKILRDIRRKIAEENDIEFITSECQYKGDCSGTCPKCESEVRYLEQQLRIRSLAGKAVKLAGVSAGVILSIGYGSALSSCNRLTGDISLEGELPADTLDRDDTKANMLPLAEFNVEELNLEDVK